MRERAFVHAALAQQERLIEVLLRSFDPA